MAYSSNNAYDLSLFEPRPAYVRPRAEAAKKKSTKSSARSRVGEDEKEAVRQSINVKRADRTRLIQWMAVGMVAICMVSAMMISRAEYHELTQAVNSTEARLAELEQDYESLRMSFDNKMSDSAVEEYAQSVLGMQKRENSQTEYISLGGEDFFEIGEEDSRTWLERSMEKLLSYTE